jgi:hypothetical protein
MLNYNSLFFPIPLRNPPLYFRKAATSREVPHALKTSLSHQPRFPRSFDIVTFLSLAIHIAREMVFLSSITFPSVVYDSAEDFPPTLPVPLSVQR